MARQRLHPHQVALQCGIVLLSLEAHIYTGELLGSSSLPVENWSAALRLCSAASMLVIDDLLPELPSVVLASIVTSEDASMALGAVNELPVSIAELLEGLSVMPPPTSFDIQKMISASSTTQARDATSHILSAHRGRLDRAVIVTAAKEFVTNWRHDGELAWRIDWLIRIVREHFDCAEATSLFAHFGRLLCDACRSDISKWQADFLAHLMRCASSNCLTQAIALGNGKFGINCVRCLMSVNRRSILSIDSKKAAELAEVIAAAPRERAEVAAQLAEFPQLVDILSDATVVALGASFGSIIDHLISNPYLASKWFTNDRLLRLPLVRRRAVSIVLLRDATPYLSAEVAKTVASTLA